MLVYSCLAWAHQVVKSWWNGGVSGKYLGLFTMDELCWIGLHSWIQLIFKSDDILMTVSQLCQAKWHCRIQPNWFPPNSFGASFLAAPLLSFLTLLLASWLIFTQVKHTPRFETSCPMPLFLKMHKPSRRPAINFELQKVEFRDATNKNTYENYLAIPTALKFLNAGGLWALGSCFQKGTYIVYMYI